MYIPTILGNPSSVLLSNEFNFQTAFRILFFIIINSCPRKCNFKNEVTKTKLILLSFADVVALKRAFVTSGGTKY